MPRTNHSALRINPRNQFNSGYHDARADRGANRRRQVVDAGPQTILFVSREYDPHYAAGYEAGYASPAADEYSTGAFRDYLARVGYDRLLDLQVAAEAHELARGRRGVTPASPAVLAQAYLDARASLAH